MWPRFVGIGLLALVCAASNARAEPVTFDYQVNISQRCTASGCVTYPFSFVLTLRFDPAAWSATELPDRAERWYGPPTFSAVPLARPDVMAGATQSAHTADVAFLYPPFDWRRVGHVQQSAQLVTDEFDYRWHLGIYEVQDYLAGRPELSAASLARFLGTGMNPTAFSYSFAAFVRGSGGQLAPSSVGYSGTAHLLDGAAPVPEPLSMLLVGTGLAAMGVVARRRRRSDSS